MCVFLISPVPITEPLTSELIDTPVFYNLAPRPIKYRVSVPIPRYNIPVWIWNVSYCSRVYSNNVIYFWVKWLLNMKKKLGFYPLGFDMNMKVCIACDFCYPSSNMYNFEQVLNLLSWLFVPLLQQSPPARWERHKGGMMSKGDERRVLRTGGRKFGWLSRDGSLSFPSSIYFLAILSVSHLLDSDSRFFCSFGCFTSSENRWKASAPIEGEKFKYY